MNPGYGLGIGIICAPFISAILLGLHHTVRSLYRHARTHTRSTP